jgi:hypothetical protein
MGVAAQDYQTRRGVAQPGSVLAWGASGRPFKSARPDQFHPCHIVVRELPLSSFFYV